MAYLFFLLYSVFCFSTTTPSLPTQITPQQANELSHHPQWLRLLHFDDPKQSKVTSLDFFVSKKMHVDSETEFKLFFEALKTTPINDEHVQCRYPSRTRFVYQQLAPTSIPDFKNCAKLSEFIQRTAINSVSVVFSSYYLHNPSSAFGHTLLKINRKTNDDDLLNYGINFAATVDTENPFAYAVKGLFGLFKGQFTAVPYYYKVREYNDFESRDLWSYQLNLTDQEKELLLLHVWELGEAWAPYYYFDENCSYWVLRALEASSLRLNLINHLPSTHVLPIDTVRTLFTQEGFVEGVLLRPSLRKKVAQRFSFLSSQEIKDVKNTVDLLVEHPTPKESMAHLKTTKQVDAALDYFDYKNAKLASKNEQEFENLKKPLLIQRSQLREPPLPLKFENEIPPHKFHPSGMVSLGGGVQATDQPFTSLRWKPALHDLIDPHTGFDFSSEINFLDTEIRFYQKENENWGSNVRKFDFIRMSVLTPADSVDMKMAWRLQTGVQPLSEENAIRKNSVFFALAPGYSFYTPGTGQRSMTYFLLHSEVNQHRSLEHELGVRVGPTIGSLTNLTDNFKISLDLKYLFDYRFTAHWDEILLTRLQAQYYFSGVNMAVLADLEAWDEFAEAGLYFKYYF